MERRNRVLKLFSGMALLCRGMALLCRGMALLCRGMALLCPKKKLIYRHFKRILGDPEVTANLSLFLESNICKKKKKKKNRGMVLMCPGYPGRPDIRYNPTRKPLPI